MISDKFLIQFQGIIIVLPILLRISFLVYSGSFFSPDFNMMHFLGYLLWFITPYAILAALAAIIDNISSLLSAAILMLIIETVVHLEVFVSPSSSTSALLLLFMPFWQLVLVLPVGVFFGKLLSKKDKESD